MDERLSEIPNARPHRSAICINSPTKIDVQHPKVQVATDKYRVQFLVLYRVITFTLGLSDRVMHLP